MDGRYVAQGTVQVRIHEDGLKVTFNPVSDYRVKHTEKEYAVFVAKSGEPAPSCLISVAKEYTVVGSEAVKDALRQAGFAGTRVEIEVEFESSEIMRVVGVRIPATQAKH